MRKLPDCRRFRWWGRRFGAGGPRRLVGVLALWALPAALMPGVALALRGDPPPVLARGPQDPPDVVLAAGGGEAIPQDVARVAVVDVAALPAPAAATSARSRPRSAVPSRRG